LIVVSIERQRRALTSAQGNALGLRSQKEQALSGRSKRGVYDVGAPLQGFLETIAWLQGVALG
jgi:hypothetical protein